MHRVFFVTIVVEMRKIGWCKVQKAKLNHGRLLPLFPPKKKELVHTKGNKIEMSILDVDSPVSDLTPHNDLSKVQCHFDSPLRTTCIISNN